MFKERLISGIILVLIALLLIVPGGDVTLMACCCLALIGMFEIYRMAGIHKSLILPLGFIAAIVYYGNLRFGVVPSDGFIYIPFLLALFFVYVFGYPKYEIKEIALAFLSFFYVAVLLSFIYQTRVLNSGKYLVWLIIIFSWGSDTFAYVFGRLFGKHKMASKLSPKKTIEGAVGGVFGAILLTAIYVSIFRNQLSLDTTGIVIISLIAGVAGLVSMIGDLTASAIKRNYDIKDYGHLIPGHGGIMDRFDSVIVIAPIVYFISWLVA